MCGNTEGGVVVYDTKKFSCDGLFSAHFDVVTSVSRSPSGLLATGSG